MRLGHDRTHSTVATSGTFLPRIGCFQRYISAYSNASIQIRESSDEPHSVARTVGDGHVEGSQVARNVIDEEGDLLLSGARRESHSPDKQPQAWRVKLWNTGATWGARRSLASEQKRLPKAKLLAFNVRTNSNDILYHSHCV